MENQLGHVMIMGSNGLLGSAIIELLQNGHGAPKFISGFDVSENINQGISFTQGDIRDYETVKLAVSGKDVVINTVSVLNFNPKNDAWMESINVGGAENVLKACISCGIQKLVHTSSMDVVYEGKGIANGDESLPYAEKFLYHYSKTKRMAEEHVLPSKGNIARCALRATGIYGPNDHVRFPIIMKAVQSGKYATIGGRNTKYSHVYSYNCAYAHILAAGALEKGNALDRGAYFIVDDSTMNFHDFVDKVLEASGLKKPVKTIPVGIANILAKLSEFWVRMPWVPKSASPLITKLGVSTISKDMWYSGAKAKVDFGYEPLVPLDQAIAETAAWIKETYLN
ncbi:MAG: NAD-dependent epimerase/dehydratase family protein [Bacteroidetes bacterium]|nr:NAD-dependent epimerase/dehydratase family protein [Bacteroidota bacterium]